MQGSLYKNKCVDSVLGGNLAGFLHQNRKGTLLLSHTSSPRSHSQVTTAHMLKDVCWNKRTLRTFK